MAFTVLKAGDIYIFAHLIEVNAAIRGVEPLPEQHGSELAVPGGQ
jgi:hypothetical protein